VITGACREGRSLGGRGAMPCGRPCRAWAAGGPREPSARTSSAASANLPIRRLPGRKSHPTFRRGADYVRVTLALTIVWDAFRSAARDDLKGWEVAAAAAEVQPRRR
jgi:hypothetical protein